MSESVNRSQDAVSLDSSPTMAMTTLYSAAVGPIGNDYYLPLFSKFEAAGRATLSWNWAACLYTVNWMIFRRLWGAALVFAGAMLGTALMLAVLALLVFDWPRELLYQLLLADLGLGMLASGLWSNALFYNHCRRAMMTAVADNKTLVQACAQLSQHSSTRQRFIRMLLVNALLLSLAAAGAAYLLLWGNGSPAQDASATAPAPALTASAAEPAASAASEVASAALAPASATSAAADAVAAPSSAPASAPASSPAAMAASLPVAMPVSTPAAAALAAPASASAVPPAAVASSKTTAASSTPVPAPAPAVAASQTASKPAKAAASHAKVAAPASSHATGAARGKAPTAAKPHASGPAHAASKPAAKTAVKPTAKPAPAKATAAKSSQPAKAATPAAKALYINAGLFANPDNARNALAKLQAAGMPATAQEIDTSQGPRTRIRVGPIPSAMQAQATIEQIKALNLDAALVKP